MKTNSENQTPVKPKPEQNEKDFWKDAKYEDEKHESER